METRSLQPVVEARHLKKAFGPVLAVHDVSFNVYQGECFGILGPNGAGKTSTIRMIYGFSPLSGGDLQVFGTDILEDMRLIKSRIGVCQQENNLDPDLTVLQNLEIFARYFNVSADERRERSLKLLEFMSLDHRRNAKVSELSGGMMRRLVLARALINKPELLILDEPTTGLDPQSRHQVWERLEELKAGGISLLLTTHYMEEASQLCDRLVIMDQGRILIEGKPKELIATYVGNHVIDITRPDQTLRHEVQSRQLSHDDLGHRLIIYGEDHERLYQEISRAYCHAGCTMRMATLEDVFLKLTGRGLRE